MTNSNSRRSVRRVYTLVMLTIFCIVLSACSLNQSVVQTGHLSVILPENVAIIEEVDSLNRSFGESEITCATARVMRSDDAFEVTILECEGFEFDAAVDFASQLGDGSALANNELAEKWDALRIAKTARYCDMQRIVVDGCDAFTIRVDYSDGNNGACELACCIRLSTNSVGMVIVACERNLLDQGREFCNELIPEIRVS